MMSPPSDAKRIRKPTRSPRENVRDARWRVTEQGFRCSRKTFWGDGSFNYTPLALLAGADDAVVEDCEFIDVFRGPDAAGANNVRFVNCIVRFTDAVPTNLTAQYGFYASGGTGITYEGCRVENPYLDAYKPALGVSNVKYVDCHAEGSGIVDGQEGGGWDLYASGDRVQLIGCSSKGCGVGIGIKTHRNLNGPNVVGDIEIVGYRSEDDVFGIALEIVDAVDHPDPPEWPGVRDEAQRINIIGGLIKNPQWNGVFCNTKHVTSVGLQIHGAGREGWYLYRGARDVNISANNVIGAGRTETGTYAAVKMYGAQGVTWDKGVIDGADGETTRTLVPFLLANKNAENLLDDIVIDKPRMRNYTAQAHTMPILCGVDTENASVVVDVIGDGDPGGTPGMHGSRGSTYRRKSSGDIYKKTSAANVKTGWVAL